MLLVILTKMFNLVLDSGIVPTNWCIGVIKPLYKNKCSTYDRDNYRGTLLSCIGKLFTSLINSRVTNYLEGVSVIGEEQAGFRAG